MQNVKKLKGSSRLILYAGTAKPSPKMGQSLGPLGLNMMQFCKEFNDLTGHYRTDVPLRICLKAYIDRTFTFIIKPAPTSWYLKRCAMEETGTPFARRKWPGEIGIKYIYEIAKIKKEIDPNLKNTNLFGICKMIAAQADAMGFEVVKDSLNAEPTLPKKI